MLNNSTREYSNCIESCSHISLCKRLQWNLLDEFLTESSIDSSVLNAWGKIAHEARL